MLDDILKRVLCGEALIENKFAVLGEVGYKNDTRGAWQRVVGRWVELGGNAADLIGAKIGGDRILLTKATTSPVNNW